MNSDDLPSFLRNQKVVSSLDLWLIAIQHLWNGWFPFCMGSLPLQNTRIRKTRLGKETLSDLILWWKEKRVVISPHFCFTSNIATMLKKVNMLIPQNPLKLSLVGKIILPNGWNEIKVTHRCVRCLKLSNGIWIRSLSSWAQRSPPATNGIFLCTDE